MCLGSERWRPRSPGTPCCWRSCSVPAGTSLDRRRRTRPFAAVGPCAKVAFDAKARTSRTCKPCSVTRVRKRQRGTLRCRSTSWSRLFSGWKKAGTKRGEHQEYLVVRKHLHERAKRNEPCPTSPSATPPVVGARRVADDTPSIVYIIHERTSLTPQLISSRGSLEEGYTPAASMTALSTR